jgi:hypothetical protein
MGWKSCGSVLSAKRRYVRFGAAACALALASCATPFGEPPPFCAATIDVSRNFVGSITSANVSFVEENGAVTCEARAGAEAICAAYEAHPLGAGLAPIGAALRSCLYGNGYIRTAHRRQLGGETIIDSMRGGFRFHTTLELQLDEAGRRYELWLDERIIVTENQLGART